MARIQEVVTISDARAHLSRILADLDRVGEQADPVLIGAHRKAQGVLLSVEAFEALESRANLAARRQAVDSAAGSAAAEGLTLSAPAKADAQEFARGAISGGELVERAVARYARRPQRHAG
jgi:PHD/YefM family antitoxin component YafN of YafNO toxin-antitoxin module